jgi:galactonate dehydratase
MKIERIRLYKVAPRWQFLAIDTDAGITGWGEPVLEGRVSTVAAAVNELCQYLIGKDPRRINDIWNVLYRGGFYRGGGILMSAISGIDQALWDIKGKYMGQPVYELLGGLCRDKMKLYNWVGGDNPCDEVRDIKHYMKQGFDTFKLNGTGKIRKIDTHRAVDTVIARVDAIRSAFGNTVDFGLDFHGRVSTPMARVLIKELEPYKPLFIEEPILHEFSENYKVLADQTSIPIAAGERVFTKYDFKQLFVQGGLSIVQPDLSHAGGITECLKIAAMAEAHDVALAPHCPLGPVALASCLAVDFVSYNAVIQEQSMGIHYNKGTAELIDYVVNKEDFTYDQGYIKPLPKPGLGVVIDEEAVKEADKRFAKDWSNPIWRHDDGTFAEW